MESIARKNKKGYSANGADFLIIKYIYYIRKIPPSILEEVPYGSIQEKTGEYGCHNYF